MYELLKFVLFLYCEYIGIECFDHIMHLPYIVLKEEYRKRLIS